MDHSRSYYFLAFLAFFYYAPRLSSHSVFFSPSAGWLTDLVAWFRDAIRKVVDAISWIIKDAIELFFDYVVRAWEYVVMNIPDPSFLGNYSICSILGRGGDVAIWVISEFRLSEALALIGAGVLFNLARKIFTLGQW